MGSTLESVSFCLFFLTLYYFSWEEEKDLIPLIEEYNSLNWVPVEFGLNGYSARSFRFFFGEIFVYYIIINLYSHNLFFLDRREHPRNYHLLKASKALLGLQVIRLLVCLYLWEVFALLWSMLALIILRTIFKCFSGSTSYLMGTTFRESDTIVLLIYSILCFLGYRHLPNGGKLFFLIGTGITCITAQTICLMALIGLLSGNLPILLSLMYFKLNQKHQCLGSRRK